MSLTTSQSTPSQKDLWKRTIDILLDELPWIPNRFSSFSMMEHGAKYKVYDVFEFWTDDFKAILEIEHYTIADFGIGVYLAKEINRERDYYKFIHNVKPNVDVPLFIQTMEIMGNTNQFILK